jgi:glucose-6-phosphate 1-dehydrogenase
LAPNDIIEKKIEILRSLTIDACYRYQYNGYRSEGDVSPQSETETYAELKLHIENFRWAGVPIYIRCGKKLDRDGTEIAVRFKRMPIDLFGSQKTILSNMIIFMIQPREGIIVSMSSKEPGAELKLVNTNITFCYHDSFDKEIPEAYQRLLLDAIRGDHTLFVHSREAELSWKLLDRFLDKGLLERYEGGTVPATRFDVEWVDFESFCRSCSRISPFR